MTSEWRTADLIAEGILEIGDGYRAKNSELATSGLPFARAGNINNGFNFSDADLLGSDAVSAAGNKISQPGDVVFTSKGTVGRFAFVGKETSQFVYSPQLCYWRSKEQGVLHPRFLYYWMQSSEFLTQMAGVKGQTDMADYVSLRDQRAFKISVPTPAVQHQVASILSAFDDKIELNRRMNHTLEQMARALFKSWFVDFDPVRAKMRGERPEGMDAETAALFPDEIVEVDGREMPRGWKLGSFAEVTTINKAVLRKDDNLDKITYVEISAVSEGGISEVMRYSRGEEPSRARRRLSHGDTVLSTVRPDRKAYFLALHPEESLIASTGFAVFSPNRTSEWPFIYAGLTQDEVFLKRRSAPDTLR